MDSFSNKVKKLGRSLSVRKGKKKQDDTSRDEEHALRVKASQELFDALERRDNDATDIEGLFQERLKEVWNNDQAKEVEMVLTIIKEKRESGALPQNRFPKSPVIGESANPAWNQEFSDAAHQAAMKFQAEWEARPKK